MSGYLLTPVILRECTNDGKLASGAQLFFSESGNDIGKAVYSDLACTIPRTNPVICDASGWSGAIYGLGLYRIRVLDHNGVQITAPVDGLGSVGGEDPSSSVGYSFVGTYADIRALSGNVTVAYCTGRTYAGDGGEGLFELVPGSSDLDDDGTILTNSSGSMVWKRIVDGFLDPKWYGVSYNSLISQNTVMNTALRASVNLKIPLRVLGKIFITSNLTIPTGASIFGHGTFIASSPITVTFAAGSKLLQDTINIFGANVSAKIDSSASSEILLSYFADISDDDIFTKFITSPGSTTLPDQILVVDKTLNIASQNITTNNPLEFRNNASLICTGIISGTMIVSIPNIVLPETPYQIFNFDRTQVVAYSMNFGNTYMRPEWFGTETTDWYFEVKMACLSGHLLLPEGNNYTVKTALGTFSNLSIRGKGTLTIYVPLNVTNTLDIDDAIITNQYNSRDASRTVTTEWTSNKIHFDTPFPPIKIGDKFIIYSDAHQATGLITATAASDGSYVETTTQPTITALFTSTQFAPSGNGTYSTLNLGTNRDSIFFGDVTTGDTFTYSCSNVTPSTGTLTATSSSPATSGPILNYSPSLTFSGLVDYSYMNITSTPKINGLKIVRYFPFVENYNIGDTSYWTTPALITGHSSTVHSRINATVSNIIGFNLYDLTENGVYSKPFLYNPNLPQMLSADYLGTDTNGFIVPGKTYNQLTVGTDIKVEYMNMASTVAPRSDTVSITQLNKNASILQVSSTWTVRVNGNTVPADADTNAASYIKITPLTSLAGYWLNGYSFVANTNIMAVYAIDTTNVPFDFYHVHIPSGIGVNWNNDHMEFQFQGSRWSDVPYGIVDRTTVPTTRYTIKPQMNWNAIFSPAQTGATNVSGTIAFNIILVKTPAYF